MRNIAAKNPFYKEQPYAARLSDRPFSLKDLNLAHVRLPNAYAAARTTEHWYKGNRNNATLSAVLAFFRRRKCQASHDEVLAFIQDYQEKRATADAPVLPAGENQGIALSVLRLGPSGTALAPRNYGAMELPPAPWREMTPEERREEIRRRQSQGARYTHEKRHEKPSNDSKPRSAG